MSDVQQKFFTVPLVDINGAAQTTSSGRVIVSFDFEGRPDRFRGAAVELAAKGFASFVRIGTQGNGKLSSGFNVKAARAVVKFVIEHSGALAGTSSDFVEIYLIGTSTAAGAVATIAGEFEQVSKILLIAPDLKATPRATTGISSFVGDVAILGGSDCIRNSPDSALKIETCADVARSCRSAMVPAIDERVMGLAPFWAFFSDQPVVPESWQGPRENDMIAPPTDRTRIAQLRAKLRQYETPEKPIANPEKKLWALCQLLRGESLSHNDLSTAFYRDAPKDIEDTLSVVSAQCCGDAAKLDEADSLTHPSEIGYLVKLNQGSGGQVFTINLAERVTRGMFQTIEAGPVLAADQDAFGYGASDAAKSVLLDYRGSDRLGEAIPDSAVSSVASKLTKGGRWFLPVTYLEKLLEGLDAPEPGMGV